jgi:tRNA-specific 2-thiouridylase
MSRVVLAMSGGVDSSVAAHLLTAAGHEAIGVFMRHGQDGEQGAGGRGQGAELREPGADSDADDARRVADSLGIALHVLDLDAEFSRVIDYFVAEYAAGRTPNPCVRCNRWIKFGKLLDYADSIGADYVATGHHARLVPRADGSIALLRGIDAAKDQSYVLFGIRPDCLPWMMLPVGNYEKPAIRRIAADLGLRVADKRDSQEICFVARDRYHDFIRRRRTQDTSGELVTTEGTVVGRHEGIEGFTVGQRKGLGVALGDRKFVVRIEPDTRRVVIGDRDQLHRRELTARDVNWLASGSEDASGRPRRCYAQIRYNAPARPATMTVLDDGRLHVVFDEPQFAVTPGQAVVCYDAESNQRVLGGGWIE